MKTYYKDFLKEKEEDCFDEELEFYEEQTCKKQEEYTRLEKTRLHNERQRLKAAVEKIQKRQVAYGQNTLKQAEKLRKEEEARQAAYEQKTEANVETMLKKQEEWEQIQIERINNKYKDVITDLA
jgi:hypothetical protein